MATVNVSTWADLVAELNAAEDSVITLIDNITAPDLVTSRIGNASYAKTVNGNGYKIKNVATNSALAGLFLGGSSTSKHINFNNVDFDEIYITNSTRLFSYCDIIDCYISGDLVDSSLNDSETSYTRCGIKLSGYGNARIRYGSGSTEFNFCNIELHGVFSNAYMKLQNSYLSGDFEITGTSSGSLSFNNSYISVINAEITCSANVFSATDSKFLLVNSELITGTTLGSVAIPVSTADLLSPSTLRSAYSFPER